MIKITLLSALVGAAMFIASNASAARGVLTISGTAEIQNEDFTSTKRSVSQKDVLFILARATGDQSITNKPTKIYFDPSINTNSTAWINANETNNSFVSTNSVGIFYYSNSVAGLVRLDGFANGAYYSYMELDYSIASIIQGSTQGSSGGFWNQGAMEANSILNVNKTDTSITETGNAILYIHDNPSDFNLLGLWNLADGFTPTGTPSRFYLANKALSGFTPQNYAIVLHGAVTFKYLINNNNSKQMQTVSESFTLKGSGDMDYNQTDGTISGTATFSSKETSPYIH